MESTVANMTFGETDNDGGSDLYCQWPAEVDGEVTSWVVVRR